MRHYTEAEGLSQKHVTQILQDDDGFLWFSTWNGLNRFDGYNFHCFKTTAGDGCDMPTDRLRNIMLKPDGNIWCLADEDVFLFVRDSALFRPVSHECADSVLQLFAHNSPTRSVRSPIIVNGKPLCDAKRIFIDRQGNKWVIVSDGICEIVDRPQPGLLVDTKGRMVRSVSSDILTLSDSSLYRLQPDMKLAHLWHGASGYCLINSTEDNSFILGTKPNGIYRFEYERVVEHLTTDNSSLSCNSVYGLAVDRHGRLWAATLGGGVSCLDAHIANNGEKVRHIDIYGDTLIACTTDGLLIADISSDDVANIAFKHHRRDAKRISSLSNNATMMSLVDSCGRLVVCTESGGLNVAMGSLLSDTLSFYHLNQQNGFPADIILSAFEAGGSLWAVSSNKLIKVNLDGSSSYSFGPSFWQRDLYFSDAIPSRLPDGRWVLGLVDGALVVDINSVRHDDYVPNIVFTSISVIGGNPDYAVNDMEQLYLSPSQRSFTINFAAMDYRDIDNVHYAYRLSDDSQWNYSDGHSATFINIQPGEYNLTIRSTNADGQWVDNARSLIIVVVPTFSETYWAKLLLTLFVSVIAAIVTHVVLYIRRINNERRDALAAYLELLDDRQRRAKAVADDRRRTLQARIQTSDDAMMKRLMAFVNEHIADSDLKIDDMASAAALSKSALTRKTKDLVGLTPLDLLKEARIQKACDMLRNPDLSIADVAVACGFSDSKYFAKCFKSSEGQTPTQFRETVV